MSSNNNKMLVNRRTTLIVDVAPCPPRRDSLKILYIFRHGQTDLNKSNRLQGHLDVPLNATGIDEANQLAMTLKAGPDALEVILCSDLTRAVDTAKAVSKAFGDIDIVMDRDLREANVGVAQGMSKTDVAAEYGDEFMTRWFSSDPSHGDTSFPSGESGRQTFSRAMSAIQNFLHKTEKTCIGVGSHGGVIRRLVGFLAAPNKSTQVVIHNACVVKATYDTESMTFSICDTTSKHQSTNALQRTNTTSGLGTPAGRRTRRGLGCA